MMHLHDLTDSLNTALSSWHEMSSEQCSLTEHTSYATFEEALNALTFEDTCLAEQTTCLAKEYTSLVTHNKSPSQITDFADYSLNLTETEKHYLSQIAVNKREMYLNFGELSELVTGAASFFKSLGNSDALSLSLAKIVEKAVAAVISGSNEETAFLILNAHTEKMDLPLWHIDSGNSDTGGKYLVVAPLNGPGTLFCKLSQTDKELVYAQNDIYSAITEFSGNKCSLQQPNLYTTEPYAAAILKYNSTVHAIPVTPEGYGRAVMTIEPISKENAAELNKRHQDSMKNTTFSND